MMMDDERLGVDMEETESSVIDIMAICVIV